MQNYVFVCIKLFLRKYLSCERSATWSRPCHRRLWLKSPQKSLTKKRRKWDTKIEENNDYTEQKFPNKNFRTKIFRTKISEQKFPNKNFPNKNFPNKNFLTKIVHSYIISAWLIFVVAVLHKIQEQDERFPSTVLKILIPKHKKKKKNTNTGTSFFHCCVKNAAKDASSYNAKTTFIFVGLVTSTEEG